MGGRREQVDGAVKDGFLSLLATTFLLIAIGLLYGMTGTLGAGLVLIAQGLEAQSLEVAARAMARVVFLLFTAPLAAHLLGRAGYLAGVPLWSRSWKDDLDGKYYPETKVLKATPREEI